MSYRALVVDNPDGAYTVAPRDLEDDGLPPGDVTVSVEWSSLNYKDALACRSDGRIIRTFPMVPGIDLAGRVLHSDDPRYRPGDAVLATGYDLGVSHPGGFAQRARLPAGWLVPLPNGLTTEEAMALGTAGFTAALSLHVLETHGITPDSGSVLVTGASGGVGSTAVAMLAARGFEVAAATGSADAHDYLRALGASDILTREETSAASKRPLESERWAAAIDPVGGDTTAYLLRSLRYGGVVAISGLVGGTALTTTVLPFILRRVSLIGVESGACPQDLRRALWTRMAGELKPPGLLESIVQRTDLEGVLPATDRILQGAIRGRLLVRLA